MASFTERLQILIDADAKGAAAEIQGLGVTAERSLGSTESKVQQLSGQMVAFGSATLVAGGVAAAGLYKVAQAASDLGEAQNAANVTLGADGARALEEYADTAAQTAGISKRAALEYGASFSLFVNKAGFVGEAAGDVSADLVQLAGDISSLRNVPIEESLTAIQSALAGETEAIRRFGIDISDATLKQEIYARTGEKVSGTLTQQQKVQEIINQLYQQGAVFAGDFENTSDSLANRQRALSAEFENTSAAVGEALLPAFEAVLGTVQGAFSAFNSLPEGAKQAAGGIAGVATAAALATGGLALLVGGAIRTVDTFRDFRGRVADSGGALSRLSGFSRDAEGNLTKMGTAARVAGGALATIVISDAVFSAINDGTDVAGRFADAINDVKIAAAGTGELDLVDSFAGLVAAEQDTLRFQNLWQEFGAEVSIVGTGVKADVEQVQRAFDGLASADPTAATAVLDALEKANAGLPENSRQYQINKEFIDRNRDSLAKQAEAAEVSAGANEANAGSLDASADAADSLKGALAKLTAQQKLNSLAFDVGRARADAFKEALERSTNADELLGAGIGVGRALNDFKETLGLIPDEAEDAAEETDAVSEAMETLRRTLADTDPALSSVGISMGAAQAAASAFGQSLKQAAGISDRASSALDVGDAFRDFSRSVRRLPKDLDLVALTMGQLRPRARDAVRDILELGDSVRGYLETLLQSGATYGEVTDEAARFRDELQKQLLQAGLTQEQVDEYIRTLGLAPDQVATAIKLSGLESSRFKLNAYIQLLDGKIPPEVATQVIAQINADDLDGAAATLEAFAKTNPQVIDVAPKGTAELEEAKGTIEDLPRSYDALTAAMGGYTDQQLDALDSVLGLGEAYRDFLGELAAGPDKGQAAIDFAARLREQFAKTVEGLNLTEEELESYYQLLGIAEDQVVTSIELANFDATVFEITTVISLLQGIGELDPEVALRISDALLSEDYDEVRRLLEGEVKASLDADTEPAKNSYDDWTGYVFGHPPEDVPVDADTSKAKDTVDKFGNWLNTLEYVIDVIVPDWLPDWIPGAGGDGEGRQGARGYWDRRRQGEESRRGKDAGRAVGGAVMPNRRYLVGEEGPELLEFGKAAAITPAKVTAQMLSPSPSAMVDFDPSMFTRALQQIDLGSNGVTIERVDITEAVDARATGAELVRQLSAERFLRGAA